MALKVLLLRKKLTEQQNTLRTLEQAAEGFDAREAELAADIEAAQTEEERSVVTEAATAFDDERAKNEADQKEAREAIEATEEEIRAAEEAAQQARQGKPAGNERKDEKHMEHAETRTRFFGMNAQERDAFFANQEIKDFLERTRELAQQKRSVSGAELLIPTIALDLVREQTPKYSKLLKHLNVRSVPGKARQNIMGTIPEAVWTEMCGKLNELTIGFNNVEVDGYKVGGYIAICNALLEDSDIALASEILTAISQAIGYALDKAVLYGTGTKMPLGIVTRLAQTAEPADYPSTARAWADLSTSNVLTITAANSAGIKLFQNIIKNAGAAKGRYSRGVKFWAMNETTYTTMMAEALSINASGAISSGMTQTMPIIGGAIETLDFIPDNVIVGGYGDLYLLAERAGTALAQSEHVRFLDDQTVFKGTARYDGLPVIPEGFVAMGINAAVVSATAVSFVEDKANAVAPEG